MAQIDNYTDDVKRSSSSTNRRQDEGASEEDVRSSRDKFRQQTFFVIIDTLIAELIVAAYSSIVERFAVFRECLDQEGKGIRVAAQRLVAAYMKAIWK